MTLETELIEHAWYLINSRGRQLVGQHVKGKGNNLDFPQFRIGMLHADPYVISVDRVCVVGRMDLVECKS